jgi:hypothetical protein
LNSGEVSGWGSIWRVGGAVVDVGAVVGTDSVGKGVGVSSAFPQPTRKVVTIIDIVIMSAKGLIHSMVLINKYFFP